MGSGNQLCEFGHHYSCLLAITHTLAPSAPTILAVEATSSTSISVKWAACTNDGGSSITGYVVEYCPALYPASPFETHLLGEDVILTTLDNLAPSTEYEVRVRVENAVGRSDPSVTMRAKTKVDGELNFQVVCRGSFGQLIIDSIYWTIMKLFALISKHECRELG